jgi:hypothetical protein
MVKSPAIVAALYAQDAAPNGGKPIRLAGLNHGHVSGFLRGAQRRKEVEILGVWDPESELLSKYAKADNFAAGILYTDLAKICMPLSPTLWLLSPRQPAMPPRWKPARRVMQQAAATYGINVRVNYETTWYRNYQEIYNIMHHQKQARSIRKMVAMDGHTGPQGIHVQPEFLASLSDPSRSVPAVYEP